VRVLHVARVRSGKPELLIHVEKWTRMLDLFGGARGNQAVWHHDHEWPMSVLFDVVVIHALNQRPWVLDKVRYCFPGAAVVGLSYNDLWTQDSAQEEKVYAALEGCDLSFGRLPDGYPAPARFHSMRPLVDTDVFSPLPVVDRDIDVLVASGWKNRDVYWSLEARRALSGRESVHICDGSQTPEEIACLMRRARVVLALREYLQPSYAIVEAVHCGAPVVVSDTPGLRALLASTGAAALVERDAKKINSAIDALVKLCPAARDQAMYRARAVLSGWTLQSEGPRIVGLIREAVACLR